MSTSELIVVGLASSVAMLVKSTTGLGYPMLAIPMVAAVTGVENAVVVVTLPNAAANVLIAWRTRSARSQTRDLAPLATSAAAGAVIGTFVLISAPEDPLLILLAATILLFVVRSLWFGDLSVSSQTGRRASPAVGLMAGVMQGAVGVSGPIVASWLYAYRLPRDAYILSITTLFLLAGLAQMSALAAVGAYNSDRLIAAAAGLGPVLAVLPLGERLRARLSGEAFDRAVLGLLAVTAVALAARVITG